MIRSQGAAGLLRDGLWLGADAREILDLFDITAHTERRGDLDHAKHDQPNAAHQRKCHDRIEWEHQRHDAGGDADDAERTHLGQELLVGNNAQRRRTAEMNPTPIQVASGKTAYPSPK